MHVPTDVSVLAATDRYVDYRCGRCRHVAVASVRAGGTGLQVGGVSVSNAELDAQVNAARTVNLARCPRCGHRDRLALAKVLALGATVGLVAGMAAGLTAAEQLRVAGGDDIALQLGLGTFVCTIAATTALKLRSVARRVRFHRVVG